jgi:hypothetical protein
MTAKLDRFAVEALLSANGGNVCRAARAAQVHRNTFTDACHKLGINPDAYRIAKRATGRFMVQAEQAVDAFVEDALAALDDIVAG